MPTDTPQNVERGHLRSAGLIGLATMGSRVLGLVREHLFAKLMGMGVYSDAFVIAYRIPNLLRELVAEGALSSAFVPVFAEHREKRGDAEAMRLAQVVFTGLLVLGSVLVAAGIIFAPQLVDTFAAGFQDDSAKRSVTIELTRWMMPFLVLAAWAALCRGVLNSYGKYLIPALSPAFFNLVPIIGGFAMVFLALEPARAAYGWALAFLVGGALAYFVQVPAILRLGLRPRLLLDFRHPGFVRILKLMGPATLGLAALQINILVNSNLASRWEDAVSALNYAYRLVYLPVGVIGVAIATVTTVEVSRHAARTNFGDLRASLASALRHLAFFTLPGTAGLIVLSEPIVRLLYDYGRFADQPENVATTARSLVCYSWALFFYCGVKVLAPTFYALDRIRVPVIASVSAVGINVLWSTSTADEIGFQTLAIGTAIASTANFLILVFSLVKLVGGFPYRALARSFTSIAVLTLVMTAAVWQASVAITTTLGTESLFARILGVVAPMLVAAGIYLGGGKWFGLKECADFVAVLSRKLASHQ